jgi:hypothetical protein
MIDFTYPRPPTVKQRYDIKDEKTVQATGSVYRHLDDGVAIFSTAVNANIQVTMWRFMSRHPGKYRFRISGYADQSDKNFTMCLGPAMLRGTCWFRTYGCDT